MHFGTNPQRTSSPLLDQIEAFRLEATSRLPSERRASLGQFLTPCPIAKFMASLFEFDNNEPSLRLLDPGAGVGSLFAAVVQEVCWRPVPLKRIEITACELDPLLLQYLPLAFEMCAELCADAGIEFEGSLWSGDFLQEVVARTGEGLFATQELPEFDAIVMNPPYRKITSQSEHRRLLRCLGIETSNLYTGFLSASFQLLRPSAELVAITPRSFCNGPYFRLFRDDLLERMALRRVHLLEARDVAFSEDQVLQENLIFHAVRAGQQGAVTLSAADGEVAGEITVQRQVPFDQVVLPRDKQRFIHLTTDELGQRIAARVNQLTGRLPMLGLNVSTGRVVDFRSREHLRSEPSTETIPLLYPSHLSRGRIVWPQLGGRKPNSIEISDRTRGLLVPNGSYVLVKRFTSKEERRRVVAVVYDGTLAEAAEGIAFENHLNFFHVKGTPLDLATARGLAAYLNSTLVDAYFRQFNGHTQVNATDLRNIAYPTLEQLQRLGRRVAETLPQEDLDQRVEEELFSMTDGQDPARAQQRIQQGIDILKALGFRKGQQNERSALSLLGLLDLVPDKPWSEAEAHRRGVTELMGWFRDHYGKDYAPNTRETVRRQTLHQFVQAGLVLLNPDDPLRSINSPGTVYQIEPAALALLRSYGTNNWDASLRAYLADVDTLKARYAAAREVARVPVKTAEGKTVTLTPGQHNELIREVVEQFGSIYTPGGTVLYIGDTGDKFAIFEREALSQLGVEVDQHGPMPDVLIHDTERDWLVIVEAVTSHGPVDLKRKEQLEDLFDDAIPGLVFVTAFLSRADMVKYLTEISWETDVWVAETPDHLIHFNGERFLGPYEKSPDI